MNAQEANRITNDKAEFNEYIEHVNIILRQIEEAANNCKFQFIHFLSLNDKKHMRIMDKIESFGYKIEYQKKPEGKKDIAIISWRNK